MEKSYRRFIWLIALILALVFFVKANPSTIVKGAVTGLLVVVGYHTGALAVITGPVIYILSIIATIPPLSFIFAAIAATLARIHFIIFNVLLEKTVKRTAAYEDTNRRIKESRVYRRGDSLVSGVFSRVGLKEARRMRLVEVVRCAACGKDMPRDGTYCPYCGARSTTAVSRSGGPPA